MVDRILQDSLLPQDESGDFSVFEIPLLSIVREREKERESCVLMASNFDRLCCIGVWNSCSSLQVVPRTSSVEIALFL